MDYVAALALLLGIANSAYAVFYPRWRDRKASFEVRLELLAYSTPQSNDQDERIVVVNHGPARARELTVSASDGKGREYGEGTRALWPHLPVPVVHPGQSLHLKMSRSLADGVPATALVRWRDGRRGVQEETFHLSYHRVT